MYTLSIESTYDFNHCNTVIVALLLQNQRKSISAINKKAFRKLKIDLKVLSHADDKRLYFLCIFLIVLIECCICN